MGRCVLLSQTLQQLQVCLDSHYFCDFRSREVNIGGYSCFLVIASRSSTPWKSNNSCDSSGSSIVDDKRTLAFDGRSSSSSSSSSSRSGDGGSNLYGTSSDIIGVESSEQQSFKRVKKD